MLNSNVLYSYMPWGPKGIKVYATLTFGESDRKHDIKRIIKKLDEIIIGERNESYDRFKFNRQKQNTGERFDGFYSDLKELAKTCNFCDCLRNSLIRDRTVEGVLDNDTCKLQLHEKDLDLSKAVNIARTCEETRQQLKQISSTIQHEEAHVNKIQKG